MKYHSVLERIQILELDRVIQSLNCLDCLLECRGTSPAAGAAGAELSTQKNAMFLLYITHMFHFLLQLVNTFRITMQLS